MSRRQITSNDVARLAGVSQSAVSRAYREGGSISPALRAKVNAAAHSLGYTPNAFARGMIQRRSGLVGVVVDDLLHPLRAGLLDALLGALEREGLPPLLARARSAAGLAPALLRLERFRVDAVIVCGPTLPPALRTRLAEDGVPPVLLNRYPRCRGGPAVARTDNLAGGAAMARHLMAAGHRRFGLVEGPAGAPAAADRARGFAEAIASAGLPAPVRAAADYGYGGGAQAARRLLSRARPPKALFYCNDLMAMGAMDAARHGLCLDVPGDVAIAGFDGIAQGGQAAYGLTTMAQDVAALVGQATGLLVARLADPTLPGELRLVPARLVVRTSTLPAADPVD